MSFKTIQPVKINAQERARTRTLLQFRNSSVFQQVLQALVSEVQVLIDSIYTIIQERGPADAKGVQLDAIGRIVGQKRIVLDYTLIKWFAPDTIGQSVDQAPVWVHGAPTTESHVVDDAWYRKLIEAKVSRNFCKYGSVPEIRTVVKQMTGIDVGIYRVGPMQIQLVVPCDTPRYALSLMSMFWDTNQVDQTAFLPFMETVSLEGIYFIMPNSFAPDLPGRGADVAPVAVRMTR